MSSADPPEKTTFAARVTEARRDLEARMAAVGLTRARGWNITERVIDGGGGSVWVLLPMHMTERAPDDLGAVVSIDENGKIDVSREVRAGGGVTDAEVDGL